MNTTFYPLLLGLLSANLLFGCAAPAPQYDPKDYRGDGEVVDRGARMAAERFKLDFGAVDFSKSTRKTFKLANLPPVERMVIGFDLIELPPMEPAGNDQGHNAAMVRLKLKKVDGEDVFERKAPLENWTWSGAIGGTKRFVYGRGMVGEGVPTYFTPEPGQAYELELEITPLPGAASVVPARLVASGGGWKS